MSFSVVHSIFLEQRQDQKLFAKSFMNFLSRILESYNCSSVKFLFSLIFLLILKGWNLQKHCWFPKTSWRFWKIISYLILLDIILSLPPRRETCRHTIKPRTPEHGTTERGTPAEQRNTLEQWRSNGTPRNTSGTPWHTNRTPT